MRFFHLVLVLLVTSATSFSSAWAAEVKAIKGKKILIDLQGDDFKQGDILKIENLDGKTVGLAKVTKTQGHLAQALIKGKAEKGFKLSLRPPKKSSTSMRNNEGSTASGNAKYGGMLGFGSSSASVKLTNSGTTVDLTGSGFSVMGLMDYPLFSWLSFRGLGGLEQFKVGGKSNATDCNGECTAEINYLAFDLWGRYLFNPDSNFSTWAGIGFDLMFPMSKKATALSESSITNVSVFSLGGGLDWKMSGSSYIPIQVEYSIYPPSDTVSSHTISLRAGFGKSF